MAWLRKITAGLLALLMIGLFFQNRAAWANENLDKGPQKKITRHEIKVMAVPVQPIPKVKVIKKPSPEMKKYLLIGLGSLLAVGVAAAFVSTDDDSGGGDGDSDASNVEITW